MESLFRNTLGAGGWIIMGLVPLVIFALYFLKLKRQPLEVPSTYLWHRVIEDLHVNSLWQKLRKSLLLLLQLLVAALAILALLRPGWQGATLEGQRFIFLVDHSASMSATDGPNDVTRLEEAKQRIGALVDQMESGMSAMIIAFGKEPVVVHDFTSSRRRLREALNHITPTSTQTELAGALRLADGFADPRRKVDRAEAETDGVDAAPDVQLVSLFIVSDGRFAPVEDFTPDNVQPQFLPLGTPSAANMGITALSARRGDENPNHLQVFVQVANSSTAEATAQVSLTHNGRLIDAMELTVPAQGIGSVVFLLDGDATGTLQATLEPRADYADRLAVDNAAYTVLEARRNARVLLVTPGNSALEMVLATERAKRLAQVETLAPSELNAPEYRRRLEDGSYDLIIFDQCAPREMPPANTLFVGRRPPAQIWQAENEAEILGPQIIDWLRSHPLLNLVELGNLKVVDALVVPPPLGGRVLIDSTAGPLMVIAPRDRFEDVVIGFEIVGANAEGQRNFNTNWPRQHSFPTFWLNVLEHFSRSADDQEIHRPGELVEVQLADASGEIEVVLPDGTRVPANVDSTGRLAFHETDRPGIYQVFQDGIIVKQFAVNLYDREESDVALRLSEGGGAQMQAVKGLTIGYLDVAAQPPNADVRQELWKPVLVLVLVVLLTEWYIYNRRVYI